MGPWKLKWTAEEEAAIRDGITKHGVGKWRTILKDPEFSTVLLLRSNVDLKDKWRNMQLTITGESRNSHKPVQKNIKNSGCFDKSVALISEGSDEDEIAQPEPPSLTYEAPQEGSSNKLTSRSDNCKLEGLTNVKHPSSSTQIHVVLQSEQLPPPNLEKSWRENVKKDTVDGKLSKVMQEMEYDSEDSESLLGEVDAELMRIRKMSPEDAVAAAAAAVKEAEAAIAEAEEAEKDAVEAERAAEEATAYAEELEKILMGKKAIPAPKRGKRGRRGC